MYGEVYICLGHTDIWGIYWGHTDVWGHTDIWAMYSGHTNVWGSTDIQGMYGCMGVYRCREDVKMYVVYRCMRGHTDTPRHTDS